MSIRMAHIPSMRWTVTVPAAKSGSSTNSRTTGIICSCCPWTTQAQHFFQNTDFLAVVQDPQTDEIGDKMHALLQFDFCPIDSDDAAHQRRGLLGAVDPGQLQERTGLVDAALFDIVAGTVKIDMVKFQQKLRAICPGQDLQLPPDTVGGDDLPRFQKLFHCNTSLLSVHPL